MSKQVDVFVTTLDIKEKEALYEALKEQGFSLSKPSYTHFQAKKKGVSLTYYESGKLVVQGKEKHEFITFFLEPHILKNTSYSYNHLEIDTKERIGIDEAGKGDYFGPLCIAGVYVHGEEDINQLLKLGVKDSKKIQDHKILELAKKIKTHFRCALVCLKPLKYNELYNKFKNLNTLLAWGHASGIEKLYQESGCSNVIIDQFAHESVVLNALKQKNLYLDVTQRHRGEEDVVVAAASILARAAFLKHLENLRQEYKIAFPLGASHLVLDKAKEFIFQYGENRLAEVAKLHFKTTDKILKKNPKL